MKESCRSLTQESATTSRNTFRAPGRPFISCVPASSRFNPEPSRRSYVVDDTRTSSGPPSRHDPRGRVNGETLDVTANELDLTCVDPHPNRQTHLARGARHRRTATYGPRGAVENREETVTSRFHLAPAKDVELVAETGVVAQ